MCVQFFFFQLNLASSQYFQVGLVSGGVSKCGDKYIPSYFTRLDHPEIADFISAPELSYQSAIGSNYDSNITAIKFQRFHLLYRITKLNSPRIVINR